MEAHLPGYRYDLFAADGSAVTSVTGFVADEIEAVSQAYDLLEVWPTVEVWHDRGLVMRLSDPSITR
jgi:hypothetical protein